MSRKNVANANIILDRIKEAYDLSNDSKLASFLKVNTSTVASWRKREAMKFKPLFEFASELNMNWLFFGDSPVWRADIQREHMAGMVNEPPADYGDKTGDFSARIKKLNLPPEKKLHLLNAYLEILEEAGSRS